MKLQLIKCYKVAAGSDDERDISQHKEEKTSADGTEAVASSELGKE